MPRKIQPNQIITHPKKIIFLQPENNTPSFWEFFVKILAVQVLAVLAGTLTAGVGTAIVEGIGFSELGVAATSMIIQTGVNFAVNQTYDLINNNATIENTIFNLLFGITDIGKFGRALKYDKLLKILNENKLLAKVGINQKVKNFFEVKESLKYKDIILQNKVKLTYKKVISNEEILQTISILSTAEMKKELKKFSKSELKTFLEIEKILYKINPSFLPKFVGVDLKKYNLFFKNEIGITFDNFLKMTDEEVFDVYLKFQKTTIGNQNILNFNRLRIHSKFQETLLEKFKILKVKLKNKIDKINPLKILEKIIQDMFRPIENFLNNMKGKAINYLSSLNKSAVDFVKKYNLIPCQTKSYLLAFKFEPTSLAGEGFIEIWKKPYAWKSKPGKVSYYRSVRVWTNLLEVEKFVFAKDQNSFYESTWGLGKGYSQSSLKVINLISPGVAKIISESNKFFNMIKVIQIISKTGALAYLKDYSISKTNQFFNQTKMKYASKLTSWIPGVNLFTPTISRLILGKGFDERKTSAELTRKVIKKPRRVGVINA